MRDFSMTFQYFPWPLLFSMTIHWSLITFALKSTFITSYDKFKYIEGLWVLFDMSENCFSTKQIFTSFAIIPDNIISAENPTIQVPNRLTAWVLTAFVIKQ